ncbi:HNH endonuclease domain-containing protein [Caminibacter pacificus]
MEKIDLNSLIKINKIIEKDNLSSSYKLALLKGTIFVVNKFDHFITVKNKKVKLPFYFLVEQWFFDYLPFVYDNIKQQTNKKKAQILNKQIESLYRQLFDTFKSESSLNWKEIYSVIYYRYHNDKLDKTQKDILLKLFKEIRKIIKDNPMKYIGDDNYEIFFDISNAKIKNLNYEELGTFCIKEDIYNVFKYLGYNLLGLSTILKRWVDFTLRINPELNRNQIFNYMIYEVQDVLRDTHDIRKLFNNQIVECVWSGKKIKYFDVDHIIPFSIYFNNDLWNLMPSDKKINNKKRDKIPTPELIEKRKDILIYYWKIYKEKFSYFLKQREISLGKYNNENEYILTLQKKCDFLISKLGFDYFEI